jgi:hypothetical protein
VARLRRAAPGGPGAVRRVGRARQPGRSAGADPYIPMLAYTRSRPTSSPTRCCTSWSPRARTRTCSTPARTGSSGWMTAAARRQGVALSGSPNARDGARTTFQHFDEPHRMTLQSLLDAHETMLANLPKRPLEDPWSLYTTTAGEPGARSVAEQLHVEAQKIDRGEIADPELFYFHREAGKQARPEDRRRPDPRDRRSHRPGRGVRARPVPRHRPAVGTPRRRPAVPRAGLAQPVGRSEQQAFDVNRFHELTQRPADIPEGTAHILEPGGSSSPASTAPVP